MFFLARGDAQVTYLVLNVRDEGVFFYLKRWSPFSFISKALLKKKLFASN
jgi:hypothetical protein